MEVPVSKETILQDWARRHQARIEVRKVRPVEMDPPTEFDEYLDSLDEGWVKQPYWVVDSEAAEREYQKIMMLMLGRHQETPDLYNSRRQQLLDLGYAETVLNTVQYGRS